MKRVLVLAIPIVIALGAFYCCWTSEPAAVKEGVRFAPAVASSSFTAVNAVTPLDLPIVFVPVTSVKKDSEMVVSFLFRNTSDDALHYVANTVGPRADCPAFMQADLWRDGQPVSRLVNDEPPVANRDSVRGLGPGEWVVYRVSLASEFGIDQKLGNLPAGRYELRATYEVREGDLQHEVGCTPLHVNRTVLLIDIVE